MALAIFTLHVAKNQAMLWSIEHYITLLLLFIIAFKCILNVHWLIALVQKVHNFEIRSFFHFPTPKKPLRTNFLPSLISDLWWQLWSDWTINRRSSVKRRRRRYSQRCLRRRSAAQVETQSITVWLWRSEKNFPWIWHIF